MIKKVQANNYRNLECIFGIDFLKQQRDGHERCRHWTWLSQAMYRAGTSLDFEGMVGWSDETTM